jgi:hypothetical protein
MSRSLASLALLGCVLAAPILAQQKQSKPKVPAIPLATSGLAGQGVAVLPLTLVVGDPQVPGSSGPKARAILQRWADSLLGDALAENAPEVNWILPPALRATARRAPGLLPSPDQMGQAVMRSSNLKALPDPLRGYVRQLLGLAGAPRYALIPATLYLSPAEGDSLTVQLAAVLADGRLGRVVWRTLAVGRGETADQAFRAALATMFPPDPSAP